MSQLCLIYSHATFDHNNGFIRLTYSLSKLNLKFFLTFFQVYLYQVILNDLVNTWCVLENLDLHSYEDLFVTKKLGYPIM